MPQHTPASGLHTTPVSNHTSVFSVTNHGHDLMWILCRLEREQINTRISDASQYMHKMDLCCILVAGGIAGRGTGVDLEAGWTELTGLESYLDLMDKTEKHWTVTNIPNS